MAVIQRQVSLAKEEEAISIPLGSSDEHRMHPSYPMNGLYFQIVFEKF